MYKKNPLIVLIRFFDTLKKKWESPVFIKNTASVIVVLYLLFLLLIGLKYFGLIDNNLRFIPSNPFKAIEIAFTMLLYTEVVTLVFSIEESVSKSMTIQLEILSLILLRSAFKIFGSYFHSIDVININEHLLYMFADSFTALIIFTGIILIKRIEKPLPKHHDSSTLHRFINIKRIISLIMLLVFTTMIILEVLFFILQKEPFEFFKNFYTILIFTDILIVLVSLRYSYSYLSLFRNSGYALATIIIRIALSTSAPYNALLGLTATLFVIGIVASYNKLNFE